MRGKVGPVLLRHRLVSAQHIDLDLYRALLAHAGHRHPGRTGSKVQVTRHLMDLGFCRLRPGGGAVATAYNTHKNSCLLWVAMVASKHAHVHHLEFGAAGDPQARALAQRAQV